MKTHIAITKIGLAFLHAALKIGKKIFKRKCLILLKRFFN